MSATIPSNLKSIAHYIKIANEHANRDPVIYYWCLFYAVQTGMSIDKSSPDCIQYLTALLNTLEQVKKQLAGNEAISSDIVAQAHIEQMAIRLFNHGDNEDRAGRYGKNLVKTFYTAGHLMDVLTLFGELDEQLQSNRKYAKWKATYIHNCLKNGETPVPGPPGGFSADDQEGAVGGDPSLGFDQLNVRDERYDDKHDTASLPPPSTVPAHSNVYSLPQPASDPYITPAAGLGPPPVQHHTTASGVTLKAEDFTKAQKYAKYAVSALSYEDTVAAVENLQKALNILTTCRE
uniref:Uncharacterized protein n=1 Tax=Plectus sambesii TaxID=2011161 RepID=A0A914V161_9BILA